MLIGDLARRAGVSAKTVRFYEGVGVLPEPARSPNGYRTYGEQDVARLAFVRGRSSWISDWRRSGRSLRCVIAGGSRVRTCSTSQPGVSRSSTAA